jgi:hypothetical protein
MEAVASPMRVLTSSTTATLCSSVRSSGGGGQLLVDVAGPGRVDVDPGPMVVDTVTDRR